MRIMLSDEQGSTNGYHCPSPENAPSYYCARYYDASSGRFNSEDPIRFDDGWANLYLYVTNRPIDLIDRFGLSPQPTMTSPIAPILICPWCNQFLLGSWEMWTNYKRMEEMKWVKATNITIAWGTVWRQMQGRAGRPPHKYLVFSERMCDRGSQNRLTGRNMIRQTSAASRAVTATRDVNGTSSTIHPEPHATHIPVAATNQAG